MSHNHAASVPSPPRQNRPASHAAYIAIGISIISACIALASAVYTKRTTEIQEQRNLLMIKEKIFDVQADDNWNITITQVGGAPYPLQSVTLTPSFEQGDNILPGRAIEISLETPEIRAFVDSRPRYFIGDVKDRVCKTRHPAKFASTCLQTPLYLLKVEYAVENHSRTIVCQPGRCES